MESKNKFDYPHPTLGTWINVGDMYPVLAAGHLLYDLSNTVIICLYLAEIAINYKVSKVST